MGLIKIITKSSADNSYLNNCFRYINDVYYENMNNHTLSGYYDGFNINPYDAYNQMMTIKQYFGKTSGNQLIHIIVSFNSKVFYPDLAMALSRNIAKYYADRYQIIYGIHADTRHSNKNPKKVVSYYHTHLIINSVSFIDGRMFAESKGDISNFVEHIKHITNDNYWNIYYQNE